MGGGGGGGGATRGERGVRGVRDADRGDADIGRTTPVTAPYFGLAAGSGMCRVPRLRKGTPWFMRRDCAVRLGSE